MCKSWIIETELRKILNLDLNHEFSVSDFKKFQKTASVLHDSTQTINQCYQNHNDWQHSMKYVSLAFLPSMVRKDMVLELITLYTEMYEKLSLRRDTKQDKYTLMHCEKVVSIMICDYSETICLV